jgi:hypothetical protein
VGTPCDTVAAGREAVNFHQSNCKKPRVFRPLDPSHYGQSPKAVAFLNDYFLKKATDSRRKFGLDGNENPNYGREAVGFFSLNNQSLTRSWPLDWRDYFEQGIKWHAPLSLDFGLGLWRLHTLAVQVETLEESLSITTGRCDLAIATHARKMHNLRVIFGR